MEMSATTASAVVNSALLFIANVIVWSSLESSVAISISSCLFAILWLLSSVGEAATESSVAIIRQMTIDNFVLRNALHDWYRARNRSYTDWNFNWDDKESEVTHHVDAAELYKFHQSNFEKFFSELRWRAFLVATSLVTTCFAAALGIYVRPWMAVFLAWIG